MKLSAKGVRTIAVARHKDDLDSLAKVAPTVETRALDAAKDGTAQSLMSEYSPDLLVLAGGHQPKMQSISQLTWQDFSATWNIDTKIAFDFVKSALLAPMADGGAIVSFASGAALGGSPLSGGYAGAKRMQHFISNYGKWDSDRRKLGLNFYTIYPKQFIVGTNIADEGSSAYAAARSISQDQFMNQWDKPLTIDKIGVCVMDLLADDGGNNAGVFRHAE